LGRNKEIVQGIYQAFARGDVPAVLDAFDPGIHWREAEGFLYADGNPYIGGPAIARGVFQRLGDDLDRFAVLPQNWVEEDDTVVVQGRYQGTMRSTRTVVDAQFAHVWRLRRGKVVDFQQYTDTRQWAKAAGV
jgi:ketosteroid isomerase-like protein